MQIVSGALKAGVFWPYDDVVALHEHVKRVVGTAIDATTPDGVDDWTDGLVWSILNRDPRRCQWLKGPSDGAWFVCVCVCCVLACL